MCIFRMSARVHFKDEPPLTAINGHTDQATARSFNRSSKTMRFPIQGKRIRICFNGDKYSKVIRFRSLKLFLIQPIVYSISAFRTYDAFLKDVNSKVGTHEALFYGVRYIFDTNGIPVDSLERLAHNETYICARCRLSNSNLIQIYV